MAAAIPLAWSWGEILQKGLHGVDVLIGVPSSLSTGFWLVVESGKPLEELVVMVGGGGMNWTGKKFKLNLTASLSIRSAKRSYRVSVSVLARKHANYGR